MASTSETGHAKNAANFNTMVILATGMAAYAPSNPELNPRSLEDLGRAANDALGRLSQAMADYQLRVDERTVAFEPVSKYITRLGKALKASNGITKENVATFAGLVRKYRGARAAAQEKTSGTPPNTAAPELHSVAQLSFDSRVAHLKDIRSLLAALPTYNSSEPDLTLGGLNETVAALDMANTLVINKISAITTGRSERNHILYTPGTGLVDMGYKLKNYISSKFSAGTPEAKSLSGLTFARPKD